MAETPTETPDDDDDRPDNIDTELPEAVIVYRAPGDLVPYEHNANVHSAEQIQRIARSIQEFGFTNPVLLRGDDVLAGHARCMAAEYLGLKAVPTIDLAHLTDDQAKAYVIADNRLAEMSGWSFDTLAVEFDALVDAGFDIELTGFTEADRLDWNTLDDDDEGEGGVAGDGDGYHCPTCGQFTNIDYSDD
jgi:hypothetical protein